MTKIDKKEKRIINLFIQVFGLLTVLLGFSAILGWISDISQLASFDSSKIPMALSSAVLFVAYGLIIFFHNSLPSSRIVAQFGIAFSSAGILAALLLFYISLNDIRSNAEHLGIKMSGTVDGLVIGHMSPVTAFCFLLVGLSLLIMFTKSKQKKLIKVSFISSVLVIVISIIFLLSYLFGTPLLYAGSFIPPALTTSLASLILGITLLIMSVLKIWSQEELSDALSTRYTYILALALIVVIVSVITTGYSYYTSYEKQYRSEIDHQLSSIAELKVSEIVRWRKERLGDAEIFYKNAEFAGLVKRFFNNQNDPDTKKRIQEWIDQVYSAYQYNRISLHDLKGGELISSPVEKIYPSLLFSKRISEVQKSGDIILEDLYRDENDKRIYLTIFIPIQSDKNIIGILAMRIDPELYLYPLINKWTIQRKTAETLLIRREGNDAVFLNELKFQKNTALNLRIPLNELSLPAAKAAMGKKEFMEGVDYRGVPVLAHVYPIPNSPWFLVARMDISEVYASLREIFWVIIIFVVVLLTGLGASVGLIWRNQHSKFHKERNLSTERIRRLNRVYALLSDINESIVRIREPQELFEKTCNIAIEKGEFQMAWIGKFNSLTKKIDLVASKGVSDGYLKKINFYYEDDESQLGIARRAIKNGVHVISNDIQNDENILPLYKESVMFDSKSSAAFPLKVFGKVWGVFKLYSSEIGFFDEQEIELLDELAMNISFAIEVDGKETERKHAEEKLRESEEKYRSFFENSMDAILLTSPEGRIFSANPAACRLFGYSEEEFTKLDRSGVVDITDPNLPVLLAVRAMTGKANGELTFIRKNGIHFPADISSAIFKDQEGLERTSMIIRDITERKRAEESLVTLSSAVEQTADSIVVTDRNGIIEYVNSAFVDLTGYSPDEVIGNTHRILKSGKQDQKYYEGLWQTILSGNVYRAEIINKKKNGDLYYEAKTISPIFDKNKNITHFVGTGEDISENKKIETNLRSATEIAKLGYWEYDVGSKKFNFSDQYFRHIHGSSTEKQGGNIMSGEEFAKRLVHPDDSNAVGKALQAAIDSPDPNYFGNSEARAIRDNGDIANVTVQFKVLKDASGRTYKVYGVNQDITERKRAEKELIEAKEKAEQSDKLKTEFLNQMSHEIRSPMNAVVSFANLLREDMEGKITPELTEYINGIDAAGKRLIRTVDLILNVSEMQVGTYEPSFGKFDLLKEIIVKIKNESMTVIESKGLKFNFSTILSEAVIFGDQYSIHQIFLNLIDNAIKYTKKGYISISVFKNERGINVSIEDTGIGMSEEFIEMMYHPFMQEERGNCRRYDGSGLGLSLVKKYCELNGITIEVESKKGIGSKFTLIFTNTK